MGQRVASTGLNQYGGGATERHVVWKERHAKNDASRRGVIYLPAKNQTAINIFTDFIAAALVDAGFIVLSVDAGNPDGTTPQWGNDTAMGKIDAAFTYLTGTLGAKTDKVHVYGGSHGGTGAINWTRRNKAKVQALVTAIAVMDLPYVHDNDIGSSAAGIEAVYGGGSWATNVAGHYPSDQASQMTDVVQKHWHSTDDAFSPVARYTDYAATSGALLQSQGAAGHNTSTIDATQIVDFLLAAG